MKTPLLLRDAAVFTASVSTQVKSNEGIDNEKAIKIFSYLLDCETAYSLKPM